MKEPVRRRYARLFGDDVPADVADELETHIAERTDDLVAEGYTPAAARAEALRRIGDVTRVRAECEQLASERLVRVRRRDFLGTLRGDVRQGTRRLRRAPGVSLLLALTLSLGIGATSAIYSVARPLLIAPLPYPDADELYAFVPNLSAGSPDGPAVYSFGEIRELRALQSVAGTGGIVSSLEDVEYSGAGAAQGLSAAWLTAELMATLGARPAAGRLLRAEDEGPGAEKVAVLSHDVAQRLFGSVRSAVEQTIRIDREAYRVVGVLEPGFVTPIGDADLWLTFDMTPFYTSEARSFRISMLYAYARLRPGVTVEAANAELALLYRSLGERFPDVMNGRTSTLRPMRQAMLGDTGPSLLFLLGAASLVLLIACANVAGVLLSRVHGRQQEFAVRTALGASRGRILNQLVVETLVLSAAGGVLGIVTAAFATRALVRLAGSSLPAVGDVGFDTPALVFAIVVTLATGLLAGLPPALTGARNGPGAVLRSQGRGAAGSARRVGMLRNYFVAAQVALSVVLTVAAVLLVRSLMALQGQDRGFDTSDVVAFDIALPEGEYDRQEKAPQFYAQLEERLRTLPGVTAVGMALQLPEADMSQNGLAIRDRPLPPGEQLPFVVTSYVTDGYFDALRIPVVRGRVFASTDRAESPRVAVISESMAQRFWPGEDAVGRAIRFGPSDQMPWVEVVGVVRDVRNDPASDPEPMLYVSQSQFGMSERVVLLRGNVDAAAVRAAVAGLDPYLAIGDVEALSDRIGETFAGRRLPMVLTALFAIIALMLSVIGVYGVTSYAAASRRGEVGVRMALGADRGEIVRLVVRDGMLWVAIGLGIGLGAALVVTRSLRSMLYQLSAVDPATYAGVAVVLLLAGVAACLLPAWRAARLDPVSALQID